MENFSTNQEPFLPTMRELARAYQAFMEYDAQNIRTFGLTCPQFDVIATLGNTQGMNMKDLAEKTLVTKGTLTGIVDRLEKKGLVQRLVPPDNRRSFIVVLTPFGEETFRTIFPAHMDYLRQRFSKLSLEELEETRFVLQRLRKIF